MVLFFYFCVLAQKDECNSIGKEMEKKSEDSAYSEDVSSEDYFFSLTSSKEKGLSFYKNNSVTLELFATRCTSCNV